MRELGVWTLNNLATPPGTSVQLIGVTGDSVVLNSKTLELHDKYTAEGTDSSFCLFGGDLNGFHSPVSIWNYPDKDMHWITDVVCRLTSYVVNGTNLPQESTMAEGAALCSTPCSDRTALSCGWNCTTDAFISCGA